MPLKNEQRAVVSFGACAVGSPPMTYAQRTR